MIIRREHKKNFTTVGNEVVEDARLSYEALGLITYLISRPDDWEVNIDQLRSRTKIGRHKIYKIVGELQDAGYLTHNRVYVEGKVDHGYWVVREEPLEQNSTSVRDSDLHVEKRDEENLRPENLKEENLGEENRDAYKGLTGTKTGQVTTEREASPDPIKFRPVGDEVEREAAFQKFLRPQAEGGYPPEAIDDIAAARRAWADVAEDQWDLATDAVPRFVRARRQSRRATMIGLTKYIRDTHWTRFPPPVDATGKPLEERVTIGPFSRGAWALFARQYLAGKTVTAALSWIRSGAEVPPGTAPSETDQSALVTVGVGSPEHVAWREHCKRLGFDLPMPDKVEFIFLPSKHPQPLSMNWKGYHLIELVQIQIRGPAWWWRVYQPGAPIADLLSDRSHGTVGLTMGPIPLPAEVADMVEIKVEDAEFADWDLWFTRKGIKTLFALGGPIWAPSKRPPALHEPLDPVPDYEAIESLHQFAGGER